MHTKTVKTLTLHYETLSYTIQYAFQDQSPLQYHKETIYPDLYKITNFTRLENLVYDLIYNILNNTYMLETPVSKRIRYAIVKIKKAYPNAYDILKSKNSNIETIHNMIQLFLNIMEIPDLSGNYIIKIDDDKIFHRRVKNSFKYTTSVVKITTKSLMEAEIIKETFNNNSKSMIYMVDPTTKTIMDPINIDTLSENRCILHCGKNIDLTNEKYHRFPTYVQFCTFMNNRYPNQKREATNMFTKKKDMPYYYCQYNKQWIVIDHTINPQL